MYSFNKKIQNVANIAAEIMYGKQAVTEKLHPNQQKLDVHEPEKDKLTAKDFKMLRKEGWDDMVKAAKDTLKDKPKPNGGAGMKQGSAYGGGKQKADAPVKEEATQAEFTAELKKAQAKAAGTAKQAQVSKPAVQAVQNEQTHTEIQVVDYSDVNGVKMSTIELDERSLTSDEKSEMEKNVKGMKKNLSGFKERYGKDAKSVMYATATKQAKGE